MKEMSAKSTTILPLLSLMYRELIRFYRQRGRLIGSIAAPLMFWLFLGSGLSAAFPNPAMPGGRGYSEYFFPGIVLLTLLFTAIFSCISIIDDRHEGFLQSVLVAPISRFALVGGKVLGGAVLASLQGILFLFLAPTAGFSFTFVSLLMTLAALAVSSLSLTALGFIFAWRLDSVQAFHSIMNLVLFPMWLLSGAFFPASGAPVWLRPVMWVNPLSYGLRAMQIALYAGSPTPASPVPYTAYWTALGTTALFGVLFYLVCLWAVQKPGKLT